MTRGFRTLLCLAVLAAAAPATPAQTTMTWTVDGVPRQALVFAPAPVWATNAQPVALVFAFHGHGGTAKAASQVMHLQTFWPGAVIVYPQGLNTPSEVDPQGNFFGWQVRAGQAGLNDRDLKFFDAMVTTMRQKFPVDNAHIYATGFSNGAIFTGKLFRVAGAGRPGGTERSRPEIFRCHGDHHAPEVSCR